MKKNTDNKRIIKWAIIAVCSMALLKASYELKILDILLGMFKLELDKDKVAKVNYKSLMYLMKKSDKEGNFLKLMEDMGWVFLSSYGRGYIFMKDGEEVLVTRREVLGYYVLFEVHNKSYFLDLNNAGE